MDLVAEAQYKEKKREDRMINSQQHNKTELFNTSRSSSSKLHDEETIEEKK